MQPTMNFAGRLLTLAALMAMALLFQFCSSTKKTASTPPPPAADQVSYEKDIAPVMQISCSPCHFPDEGRKKPLDSYAAVKSNFTDILHRVQLPADDADYMPFKSKKPALTPDQIALFKKWLEQGMPQ